MPLLLVRATPRGDGGVADDKEKENKNLTALLQRNNNDAMALAAQLLGENADLRGERRKLRTQVEQAQGKTIKDGDVSIAADRLKALEAYEALGTPEELKTAKSERDSFKGDKERLEGEVKSLNDGQAQIKHEQHLRNVAEAAGYKFSVLADRDKNTPGLSYEIKDVKEGDQTVKRVFVKFKDGDGESAPIKEQRLDTEFAPQKWGDYLPALTAQAQGAENGSQGGTRHVGQGSGGKAGGAGGNYFDNLRKAQEELKAPAQNTSKSLDERMGMN